MINLIMPTYYGGNLLRDALNSLTAQSKRTFVVTVVDDCSPNNIEKIVNEFENKLHINYIRSETNNGPGFARQAGLDFADEKWFNYVMFMDEDDVLPPWSIELLSAEAQRGNADFVSGAILEQRQGKTHTISCNNSTWLHGKIYKLSFLKENNVLDYTIEELKDYLTKYETSSNEDCSSYHVAILLYELLEEIEKLVDNKVNLEINKLSELDPLIKNISTINSNEYEFLYNQIKIPQK